MAKNLLIIDYNLTGLALSSMLFNQTQLKIIGVTSSFQNAQEKIHTNHPDVILLDPQILSDSEISSLMQDSEALKAKWIVFSKQSHPLLSLAKFIKKPERVNKETFSVQTLLNVIDTDLSKVTTPVTRAIKVSQESLSHKAHNYLDVKEIKIMLIDDSAMMKMVVSNLLSTDPSMKMIANAPNGQIGIELLNKHQPDVILLDIEMPVMDGLTFLRKARHLTKAKIIVLSSIAGQKADEIKMLGANAMIDKPDGSTSLNVDEPSSGQQLLKLIKSLTV